MNYEIDLIDRLCEELDLKRAIRSAHEIAIEVDDGLHFLFKNLEDEDDCLLAFEGTPWHGHGGLMFTRGAEYIELDYLDVVAGFADGTILICELLQQGVCVDRWPVHRDCPDHFKYMQEDEEFRIRRVRRVH